MKRNIYKAFLDWKSQKNRKPILLRGARQVGKTSIVRVLGSEFPVYVEVNFEEDPALKSLFGGSLEPSGIIQNLKAYLGVEIEIGKTLLFFDEIQECPNAIKSLRYFYEKMPNLHVIAAGSLIEFILSEISFPVGRVEFYYMYPLSFGEFLIACGKDSLRGILLSKNKHVEALHTQALELMRTYMIIGGMPEVVDAYIRNKDYQECQQLQTGIIETFFADFPKYGKKHQIKYLNTVFSAIPGQIGRKLKYTNISNLYKSRDLGSALELLEQAGLLNRVYHSSANGIPLEHEKDFKKFKVILFDIGLLVRLLRLPLKNLIIEKDISLINEGSLAEQFVGQELIAYQSHRESPKLYYWHREAKSSNAEVDYVYADGTEIIPLEVKSGSRTHLISLKTFIKEKGSKRALCLSKNTVSAMGNIDCVPLYSIERLLK